MSNDNPFGSAMDSAEENANQESDGEGEEFNLSEFVDGLNDGPKDATIGIAVTEEMHKVWQELQQDENVDVDVAESFRQHLANLAQRHETATERAAKKLEIEREL